MGTGVAGLRANPAGMTGLNPIPQSPWGQGTGLGESILLLVLASAGTAGTALLHHCLAALVEHGLAFITPGREWPVRLVLGVLRPP